MFCTVFWHLDLSPIFLSDSDSLAVQYLSLPFTKPPLLQESRLTGGGSPNLVGLVEGKVPVEWEMGTANSFH